MTPPLESLEELREAERAIMLGEYEDCLLALHRLNDKNDRVVSEKELEPSLD